MKTYFKFLSLMFFTALIISCSEEPCEVFDCSQEINQIKLNEFQFLGSHNSYRQMTDADIYAFLLDPPVPLPHSFDPKILEYAHPPLETQLDEHGIRALELDVYRDPDGGRFYYRIGNAIVGTDPDSGEPALLESGLKILHFPDFDYNSNYLTFKDALNTLKGWSDTHPNHLPLTIVVQANEDSAVELLGDPSFTHTLEYDLQGVEEIESEISDVFGSNSSQLFTPDDFRGSFNTIREAAENKAWPELSKVRGKLIFVLLGEDHAIENYISTGSNLGGRNMFVFSDEDNPETAFVNIDDPRLEKERVVDLVQRGYMVRSRADADTKEARNNFTARRISAFNSGSQLIYTDYYAPEFNSWNDYTAEMPDNKLALFNAPDVGVEDQPCFDSCEVRE